jgi:hypothetical protein
MSLRRFSSASLRRYLNVAGTLRPGGGVLGDGRRTCADKTDFPEGRPISAPFLWLSLRDPRLAVGSCPARSILVFRSVRD